VAVDNSGCHQSRVLGNHNNGGDYYSGESRVWCGNYGESASGNGDVFSSNNDGWRCWATTIMAEATTVMGVRWQWWSVKL
jgi:hypothetical protein